MTAKEWRNHADERIAALFAAQEATDRRIKELQEENAKQITELAKTVKEVTVETNRRINESQDRTQEQINMLIAAQLEVVRKVDSWLQGLQHGNGKQ